MEPDEEEWYVSSVFPPATFLAMANAQAGELDENEDFRAPARETQNLSVEDRAETNDNDHVTSEADAEGETDHDDVPMEE